MRYRLRTLLIVLAVGPPCAYGATLTLRWLFPMVFFFASHIKPAQEAPRHTSQNASLDEN
jgi:hypothetical protein